MKTNRIALFTALLATGLLPAEPLYTREGEDPNGAITKFGCYLSFDIDCIIDDFLTREALYK